MIESKRLLLRPIALSDNTAIFSYRSDGETNRYQGFIPKKLSDVDAFILNNPDAFNQHNTWFQLVVIEKEQQQIIGDVGVHFLGTDGFQCELGCTLSKNHHGKGYATEAMRSTIDYLFNSLNKHRISCSVDPKNTESIRLLERLHFRKEAHFKESLFWKGTWVDDVVYGLLKKEWNELQG